MGAKTYVDYLIEGRNQLVGHKHMMPVTAHPPSNNKVSEVQQVKMPRMSDKTLKKYIAQARVRESRLNNGIRPEVVREIQRDIEMAW